jgi:hypothetical protein
MGDILERIVAGGGEPRHRPCTIGVRAVETREKLINMRGRRVFVGFNPTSFLGVSVSNWNGKIHVQTGLRHLFKARPKQISCLMSMRDLQN